MFSVIIATRDSERALVATLAALVPGATAGIVREVIVADGGSRDDTEQVADVAGCRFFSSDQPLGARLKAAAAAARGEWLMFLDPGIVPQPGWIEECAAFLGQRRAQAAVLARAGMIAQVRRALHRLPRPAQGLIIRKSFYAALGGHRADAADAELDFLRRIGRRRLITLRTTASQADI
jgi:glycosyltransferase involved in cell wall biosynthesis